MMDVSCRYFCTRFKFLIAVCDFFDSSGGLSYAWFVIREIFDLESVVLVASVSSSSSSSSSSCISTSNGLLKLFDFLGGVFGEPVIAANDLFSAEPCPHSGIALIFCFCGEENNGGLSFPWGREIVFLVATWEAHWMGILCKQVGVAGSVDRIEKTLMYLNGSN
jgi:hypothetical protein